MSQFLLQDMLIQKKKTFTLKHVINAVHGLNSSEKGTYIPMIATTINWHFVIISIE